MQFSVENNFGQKSFFFLPCVGLNFISVEYCARQRWSLWNRPSILMWRDWNMVVINRKRARPRHKRRKEQKESCFVEFSRYQFVTSKFLFEIAPFQGPMSKCIEDYICLCILHEESYQLLTIRGKICYDVTGPRWSWRSSAASKVSTPHWTKISSKY